MSEHGLWFEGAPHDDNGRRIGYYGGVSGAWHREHNREVGA